MKIASIGAGTIGRGWACAFLAAGHDVSLIDTREAALREATDATRRTLGVLQRAGRLPCVQAAMTRLSVTTDLAAGVAGVGYVQESILEEIPAKRDLFVRLDTLCAADVTIGSSTSAIHGSAFMGGLAISPQCLVVHPTNPPYLVPLVELCPTPWTSTATLATAESLMREVGQVPVRIRRELTGYALNRLQAAVVGESLHLVGEGYISAQDLDLVMTAGLGFRWALTGPFMTGHLNAPNGYQDYMTRYGEVYRELIRDLRIDYPWTAANLVTADEMIRQGSGGCPIEELQDWRDRAMAALRPVVAGLEANRPAAHSAGHDADG